MASGWKRTAERVLATAGPSHLAGWATAPRTVVLAYHNIVPSGEECTGDRSLHLDQEDFADQLDLLQGLGSVLPLSSALEPRRPGDRETRIAITFDDAYRGTMTAGVDELSKRGLPATVFVPPGLLGATGFWWDLLAAPDGESGLSADLRAFALGTLAGRGRDIQTWATERGLTPQDLPDHALPVEESELLDPTLADGITFGAHTWEHPNLAALAPSEAETSMLRSKEWLASTTDRYVDWIAYPYGLWSPAVAEIARRHFEGALLVDGGLAELRGAWTSPSGAVPRVNIPRGLSPEGLRLRVTGLF